MNCLLQFHRSVRIARTKRPVWSCRELLIVVPIVFVAFVASSHSQTPGLVYAHRSGGASHDHVGGVALDGAGNLALAGAFSGTADFGGTPFTAVGMTGDGPKDFFIAKFSPNGGLLWLRHGGGSIIIPYPQSGGNIAYGITTDNFDNIIATGAYTGTAAFGATTLPIGGPDEDLFLVKYDTNGNVVWAKAATGTHAVNGYGVASDNDGNIFVTGGLCTS